MSSTDSPKYVGLPGLRAVREKLGFQGVQVAEGADMTPKWLSALENASGDPTQKLQRKLAQFLHCEPADLLNPSLTPLRLSQVRIDYLVSELAIEKALLSRLEREEDRIRQCQKKAGAA